MAETDRPKPRDRVYGCRRDLRDPRDLVFRHSRGRVPPSLDLREHAPPRLDQLNTGSCVAHAWIGVLRWHIRRHGGQDHALSRLQLYYDGRVVENSVQDDAGLEIRTGAKCVKKIGVGPEDLWPYDERKFRDKPGPEVYASAGLFGALVYERVEITSFAVKKALATRGPVVIGLSLFDSFESDAVGRDGVVPVPDVDHENFVGGHAMYIVGYGQRPLTFTVANSWGEDWGDNGFCYIPERVIGSTEFGADYWVVHNPGGA